MKWLRSVWDVVKHFIAPIVAYIKGRYDQHYKEKAASLKAENEFIKNNYNRISRIRDKYMRRRKERKSKMRDNKEGL